MFIGVSVTLLLLLIVSYIFCPLQHVMCVVFYPCYGLLSLKSYMNWGFETIFKWWIKCVSNFNYASNVLYVVVSWAHCQYYFLTRFRQPREWLVPQRKGIQTLGPYRVTWMPVWSLTLSIVLSFLNSRMSFVIVRFLKFRSEL